MLSFIARRIVSGVILVVAISVIAFLLLYAGGGNIARRLLGEDASAQTVAQKSHELGLDQPLLTQFGSWVSGVFHGDFGASWFTSQPVGDAIVSRLAVTLSLVLGATILIAIVSVVLGVLAATRGGWVDTVVQVVSLVGTAVPGFLIALGLVVVFAIDLGWVAPTGYVQFTTSPQGWISSIILPVIALSLGGIAGVTQQIRGSMLDSLRQDYVRTLKSRGLSSRSVVLKHVLRNAAGPGLAVLGVHFVGLLGGVVIIEQIFAIPGIGQVAVTATSQGDIPLVMGLVVATAILVVLLNLVVDLAQGWLNPKVRLS
ncbi:MULTISPECIES: ABC transporter permease [unclassified Leifsonia]|uniref:ABC transporter permease n=1 Tax=unclassified Leifsonia TaxID=2663824 RepID=UPI0008A77EAD|nr:MULTISPECIES: ABC transporter permease [unclassified Leifsonia]SEH66502.1 peptide/nickel transport system permease protein [Leifsonia sp. CL154]SFL28242.1 peptide/nickel transport system permease protein [Leifsonia sp. CL147]